MGYLDKLDNVAAHDVKELKRKDEEYGSSWKKRGGVGAFMMLSRKWDRIEKQMEDNGYDIFKLIKEQNDARKKDGFLDDIRDLRRYLMLVEAEMIQRVQEEHGRAG